MDSNVLDLLQRRYFLKDENGNLIENSWEELCARVAENIASAETSLENKERYKDLFYKALVNMDMLASSPVLFNANTPLQQLSSCFVGEQPILTSEGFKLIKDIKVGDLVVTHQGRLRSVLKTSKRYTEETLYTISVDKMYKDTLKVTGDHPILGIKRKDLICKRARNLICTGKLNKRCLSQPKQYKHDCERLGEQLLPYWIKAEDLEVGDYVVVGTIKETKDIDYIRISDFIPCDVYIKDGDFIKVAGRPNYGKEIPDKIQIDEDFMYIVGLYLGDGSVVHKDYNVSSCVGFSINSNRNDVVDKICDCMYRVFNLKPNIHNYPEQNTIQVRYHSLILGLFFEQLLGSFCDKKRIPDWILYLPESKLKSLLEGIMDSDGYHYKNDVYIVMCNRDIIEKLWLILLRLGILANIKELPIPKGGNKTPYLLNYKVSHNSQHIKLDDYVLFRVNDISTDIISDYVYNLEVEEDNTYVANGIVVHNCFIIDIDDNMESIAEAWKEASLIFKSGGGVGFNISSLRPKGALVKSSNGEASGPISFMKVFNTIVEQVKQGGRRKGAIKVDLNVEHPDIIDFIHCKDNTSELNNMNISVSISDAFMEAVKNNKDWPLVFNNKVYKVVKARDLWDEIIKSAWATGEPGLSFRDTMDRANPNPHLGHVWATNPCSEFVNIPYSSCLTGDTKVLTLEGVREIKDLVGTSGFILSENNKFNKYQNVVFKGVRPVYEIILEGNLKIQATKDHKFFTNNGWKPLEEIKKGIKIKTRSGYPLVSIEDYDEEYEMYGWMHGDGWFTENSVGISFNGKDGDFDVKERLLPIFRSVFEANNIKPLKDDLCSFQLQITNKKAIKKCEELGFVKGHADSKRLPISFYTWNIKQQISFIRGLFTADGYIGKGKNRGIILCSTSLVLLEEVQKFLASIGIQSRITTASFKTCKRKDQHKLIINKESSYIFYNVIGFSGTAKRNKFSNEVVSKIYKDKDFLEVIDIRYVGNKSVFDIIEVEQTNSFYANGLLVHNCNLASINLENMVENGELNWEKVEYYTRLTVRFLDDMIDVNKLPLKKIEEVTKLIRPIGLGTMGYANMLYKLGIPYGSQEAENLTKLLYEFIYETALDESQKLAEERGVYPGWKGSVWEQKGIKVRNANLMSIAPNGSISFIAQTTGGIEPEFALVYQRTTNEGVKYFVCNKVFKKVLQENGLYSEELLKEIFEAGGSIQELDLPQQLKDIFVVAHDLDPYKHLKTLAVVQRYVDMACSKTINLPSSATPDVVGAIYMKAWELGIKGVTVYRDGCRPNQVLATGATTKVEQEKGQDNNSRGYIIPAKQKAKGIRTKLSTGCGSLWLSAFADEDGNIIEVFTDIGRGNCISNTQALSRMISLALRGGIKLEDIIEQLQSACTCPSYAVAKATGKGVSPGKSCPSAIAVALKELQKEFKPNIEKETKVVVKTLCPQCGNELVSQSGCWQCNNCGYSKCG
jgi:ribonucleoside-diphosphate reductase alpha chain